MNIKIEKITISLGKRMIELTLEEVKQLQVQLDLLSPRQISYPVYIPAYQPSPKQWWEYPQQPYYSACNEAQAVNPYVQTSGYAQVL